MEVVRCALRPAICVVLIAIFPALGTAFFHPRRPSWNQDDRQRFEVSLSKALAWKDAVIWVDARSRTAYEKSHIPNALSLNEDEWSASLVSVLDAWRPGQKVVIYCNKRQCESSHEVAKRLRETGIEPVYVLKGGWKSWLDANK